MISKEIINRMGVSRGTSRGKNMDKTNTTKDTRGKTEERLV